jgi:hypothetical protein
VAAFTCLEHVGKVRCAPLREVAHSSKGPPTLGEMGPSYTFHSSHLSLFGVMGEVAAYTITLGHLPLTCGGPSPPLGAPSTLGLLPLLL